MGSKRLSVLTDFLLANYSILIPSNLESVESIIEAIDVHYEGIIGCMPGNVYWLDKNAVCVGCNKNVLKMLGLKSIKQFRGLSFEEMALLGDWTSEATQSFKKDTLEVIRTGKAKLNVEELPIPDKEGKLIYFLSNRVPLFDVKGNVSGIVGISIDITERKKMEELKASKEQAEAANKAKSDFVANISHDLRTPLTGLEGMARIIEKEAKTARMKKSANKMVKASNILLDFINSIIEFTKLQSGELPICNVTFNTKDLVDNIVALVRPSVLEKKLKLIVNYDKKIPKYLIGDSTRIERIFFNLIGNAIKFTHKGTIEISVQLEKKEGKNLTLKIIVKDTGIGIPKEKQQIIFSEFEKLKPSYMGIYKGYGLGLSIVKKFIAEINGKIHLKSKPKEGSTFTCYLPLKVARLNGIKQNSDLLQSNIKNSVSQLEVQNNSSISQSRKKKEKPAIYRYKVLLVEDNDLAQETAKYQLELLDCTVEIAETGEKALNLVKKNKYDLIFMDIGLPGKSGIETTVKIRKFEKNKDKHTPIIALTAHIDKDNKKVCLDSGMEDVLTKPLHAQKAREILAGYVKSEPSKNRSYDSFISTIDKSIKIIDIEFSQNYLGYSKEVSIELLERLVKSLPEVKRDIEQAYKKASWEQLQFAVHKFYGGLHYCSALRLKEATKQLEAVLEKRGKGNENADVIARLYGQLITEMERLEEEFTAGSYRG